MYDTAMVRVGERVADLEEDLDAALDALDRAGVALLEPLAERDALHELHREVGHAVLIDRELVDRDDVRVLELPVHLRFGDEAVAIERLARVRLVETLERDVAEEVAVHRRVNVPHSASRQLARDDEVRRRGDVLGGDDRGGEIGGGGDRNRLDDANRFDARVLEGIAHVAAPRGGSAQCNPLQPSFGRPIPGPRKRPPARIPR